MTGLMPFDSDLAPAGKPFVEVASQRGLVYERGKSGAHEAKIILAV
jgi:hypothetical protein